LIISKIQGGLGNQLFQWAAGKSYSIKHNCDFVIDASFYNTQTLRKYQINNFEDVKQISDVKITKKAFLVTDNYHYRQFPYDPNYIVYLDGYWQSEKYFIENKETIKNTLLIKDEMFNYLKSKYPFISDNSLSMHIRRTDYVTSNGYHPVQPLKYYQDAYDVIGGNPNILVFSDDIQWCKDNLKFDNLHFIENQSDILDMYLISMCNNNVICNSTFSWWGAWINSNLDRKVISPVKWLGENINTSDIIPSEWIKIN